MSERSTELLLSDIIESAEKILRYCSGLSFEEFEKSDLVLDAVIRNFEIIGEAANRIPNDIKELHSGIEWRRIKGFRNRIVHDYAGIDYMIVWNIISDYLPQLIRQLTYLRKSL